MRICPVPLRSAAIAALAFAVAGAASRATFRSIETRWQAAAFGAAAIAIEVVRAAARHVRPRYGRALACGAAAAVTIVAMKFWLEPQARERASIVAHEVARRITR